MIEVSLRRNAGQDQSRAQQVRPWASSWASETILASRRNFFGSGEKQ
jgi:hypothetical protein